MGFRNQIFICHIYNHTPAMCSELLLLLFLLIYNNLKQIQRLDKQMLK